MNINYALQDNYGYRWILSESGSGCNWQGMARKAMEANVSGFRLIGVRMNEIWSIQVGYKVLFVSIRKPKWRLVRIHQIRIHQRVIVKFESIGTWRLRIDRLRIDQARVSPRSWSSNTSVRIHHHTLVRIHELRIGWPMISSNRWTRRSFDHQEALVRIHHVSIEWVSIDTS